MRTELRPYHKEHLIACCFDWIIGNEKSSSRCIRHELCLYIFGKEQQWIHQELQIILEENMAYKSSG